MSRESSPNALLTGAIEDWNDLEKEYIQLEVHNAQRHIQENLLAFETAANVKLCGSNEELQNATQLIQEDHKNYCELLSSLSAAQQKCLSQIAHHRYRIKCIGDLLTRASRAPHADEEKKQIADLKLKIAGRKINFHEMEDNLPHKNGLYLRIILGQVNVSLLTKEAKRYSATHQESQTQFPAEWFLAVFVYYCYHASHTPRFFYKKDYETFKLTVSYIILALAFVSGFLLSSRWCDAVLNFLLVWYYCTLTIRESILRVNGSKIKGWWLTHHFISTVCAAISLIWPDGYTYSMFRYQHLLFVIYISCVYVLQYYYQSGCLYRLRSLGESHEMDITVEGFMSWMWKGLSFLLPFLYFGYFFQLYNAYILFQLAHHPLCDEWQVLALSGIHLMLFLGNVSTTSLVVVNKVRSDGLLMPYLKNKYKFGIVANFLNQGHDHAE